MEDIGREGVGAEHAVLTGMLVELFQQLSGVC